LQERLNRCVKTVVELNGGRVGSSRDERSNRYRRGNEDA
jgi:hypothetical protein